MISVIIPTLNEEKYLPNLLKDLKKQSLKHEVIVVDAKSKDNTVKLAKQHKAKVIITKPNVSYQRNQGAKKAKGDWLVFIDADMRLPNKHTLKLLLEKAAPGAGATPLTTVQPKERTLAYRLFVEPANISAKLFPQYTTRGGCVMVRASAFKKAGGYNQKMAVGEDLDLGPRIAKYGKIRCANVYVYESYRRYKKEGFLKIVAMWWINGLWCKLFNKSFHNTWKPIR